MWTDFQWPVPSFALEFTNFYATEYDPWVVNDDFRLESNGVFKADFSRQMRAVDLLVHDEVFEITFLNRAVIYRPPAKQRVLAVDPWLFALDPLDASGALTAPARICLLALKHRARLRRRVSRGGERCPACRCHG